MAPPTLPTVTAHHPLDYVSHAQQQQQRQQQLSPLSQLSQQQHQLFSAGGVGTSPRLGATPTPTPAVPAAGQVSGGFDANSSGDPLSHVLLRPGGMQMERDTPPTFPPPIAHQQQGGAAESVASFDFSRNAPTSVAASAQQVVRSPPPLAAEPIASRAGEIGGDGDSSPRGSYHIRDENGFGGERVSMVEMVRFFQGLADAGDVLGV